MPPDNGRKIASGNKLGLNLRDVLAGGEKNTLGVLQYTKRELTLFSNQITRQTMQLINGRQDKVNLP